MHKQLDWKRIKNILGIAAPIIGGMLSQNIFTLIDTAMIGYLGDHALAAVGISGFLFFWGSSIYFGVNEAVQVYVARYFGAQNKQFQNMPLVIGILSVLVLGTVVACGLWAFTPHIFALISPNSTVQELGISYFRWLIIGLLPMGLNFCFRSYWNGINRANEYLLIIISTHVLNIVLNWVLIFGHLGLPKLGVAGAGIASFIAYTTASLVYFLKAKQHFPLKLFLKNSKTHATLFREMYRLALPSTTRQFFFSLGLLIFYWIVGHLGYQAVAISNVLISLILIVILPGVGFGLTAMSLVSQAVGRKDYKDAHRWAIEVASVAVIMTIVLGSIGFLFPEHILGIFIQNPETKQMAIAPFRLDCATIWIEVAGIVLLNALIGAGKSATVMKVSLLCQWIVFVPLGYVLGPVLKVNLFWIFVAWIFYQAMASLLYGLMWFKQAKQWQLHLN